MPAKALLLILLMALLCGCQARSTDPKAADAAVAVYGLANIKDVSLQAAVRRYYVAESRQAWTDTYSYRSANFRDVVPFATYARAMSDNSSGWHLSRISVKSFQCTKLGCTVSVLACERFDESLASANPLKLSTGTYCSEEPNTLWRRASGSWATLDAGVRQHLPLNANVADN